MPTGHTVNFRHTYQPFVYKSQSIVCVILQTHKLKHTHLFPSPVFLFLFLDFYYIVLCYSSFFSLHSVSGDPLILPALWLNQPWLLEVTTHDTKIYGCIGLQSVKTLINSKISTCSEEAMYLRKRKWRRKRRRLNCCLHYY